MSWDDESVNTAALGWNITMPDARLVAFYNEMRAHGTADPPQ